MLDRTGVTSDPSGTLSTLTTSFDAADRPTSDSAGGSYTHDANGRMTARPGQKLEWDSLGRLTRVRDGTTNAVISSYTYDAVDRLREITTGSAVTRLRYVGLTTAVGSTYNVVSSSSIKFYATDMAGQVFADFATAANSQRSYGRNGHGDIVWLSDNTGAITRTMNAQSAGVGTTRAKLTINHIAASLEYYSW